MINKKTISKISGLTFTMKEINSQLQDEKNLCKKDILMISDILDEIHQTLYKIQNKSKNIFTKASFMNIADNIENIYSKIAQIEEKRHLDDDEILRDIHSISFTEDYLELNFLELLPSDIELILYSLDEDLQNVLKKKPYNRRLIEPIIEKVQKKLFDLHFRFDFPIVEELDENKDSFAHRLIMAANEIKEINPKKADFLTNRVDKLLDLVWIAKMFMYGDFLKAKSHFDKLDSKTKNSLEKLLWRIKGDTLKKINSDKKVEISKALMNLISQKINA